ncbi:MAG: nucleoside-diphosphate kinase [Chloroflexi bacterium]|nr:nucleoside-diphosphate kinase [Chloroflexota bacterium]
MTESQRTLVLVKPDAFQRGLAGTIIARLERRGLRIAGMKLIQIDEDLARRHYAEHEGKPFFQGLVAFITSAPVVAIVLEGPRAIEIVRKSMGATDPAEAAPGTIRGDLALEIGRNLVHGSDSSESAKREIDIFFQQDEIIEYDRNIDAWIIES